MYEGIDISFIFLFLFIIHWILILLIGLTIGRITISATIGGLSLVSSGLLLLLLLTGIILISGLIVGRIIIGVGLSLTIVGSVISIIRVVVIVLWLLLLLTILLIVIICIFFRCSVITFCYLNTFHKRIRNLNNFTRNSSKQRCQCIIMCYKGLSIFRNIVRLCFSCSSFYFCKLFF